MIIARHICTGVVFKDFYNKAAIFTHVTFEPYLGVRYMALGLGVLMTKFNDHRMSIAVEILFLTIFDKAAIFAQVTTPVTSIWVYLI